MQLAPTPASWKVHRAAHPGQCKARRTCHTGGRRRNAGTTVARAGGADHGAVSGGVAGGRCAHPFSARLQVTNSKRRPRHKVQHEITKLQATLAQPLAAISTAADRRNAGRTAGPMIVTVCDCVDTYYVAHSQHGRRAEHARHQVQQDRATIIHCI